ncbi:MAG: aminoglycoside 6-adenylyltransferase [Candidatus Bathyarchaeia archaeon]
MSSRSVAPFERLIARFTAWAQSQPDIRAAVIVGSQARVDHPADEWADLDLILVTADPDRYLSSTEWLENIGNPWLAFLEKTATGEEWERRVLFEGGLDVDFAILSAGKIQQILRHEIPPEAADIFRPGMRVLLDKDGVAAKLSASAPRQASPRPPTRDEFLEVVNDFWYHALWTAKHLRRGELWWAKGGLDYYMKWNCLLRVIEWHTRATRGWNYNTWHGGRFLEEWADPRVLQGLRGAFAHYDEEDVKRALFATMDLFRWIAAETAEKLGYPYPTEADEHVTELVNNCLSASTTEG